jgi:hypothetical protein
MGFGRIASPRQDELKWETLWLPCRLLSLNSAKISPTALTVKTAF